MAVTFKVGKCHDTSQFGYLAHHFKSFAPSDQKEFDSVQQYDNTVFSRCEMAQAGTAFVWFTFAAAAASLALSFLVKRKGSSSIV
jgi:hypothetical protein